MQSSVRVKNYWLLGLNVLRAGAYREVVNTAAFHARVRGSFPGLVGLNETKMFIPHPLVKRNLRDREVACLTSDLQG